MTSMSFAAESSSLRRAAEELLGGPDELASFVAERRAARRSWRLISRDLYETTRVDVTYETLRRWFPASPAEVAS